MKKYKKPFNIKKYVGKILIIMFDSLILWCFGWESKIETYSFRGNKPFSLKLYKDPLAIHGWLTKDHAIEVCEKRARIMA